MSDLPEPLLDYEKLDVYRCALELLRHSVLVIAELPKGETDLRSQLKRASSSVPLNIAEGTGKPTGPDRARYYATARGSAMECGALFDVCIASGFLPTETARQGRALVVRTVSMLTRLCR